MEEDNKPKLTLVTSEGKGNSGNRRSGKAESGLTEKQEAFAQGLASGLSNSEAYRQSHDASAMQQSTIHQVACRLAQSEKISARVAQILREKTSKNSMETLKRSDRVWQNVWRLAEGQGVPPSVQQAALALAAKMAGMLTDKVEIENKSADSASIERELLERLQRLKSA